MTHPAIANISPDRLARGIYWQKSWNVVTGCCHVSPGCDHCWSEREAARFARHPNPKISAPYQHAVAVFDGRWSGSVRLNGAALDLPLRTRKPTVFAVWTDLFHEALMFKSIDKVFAVMALAPQHLFLVCTKRPKRMLAYMADTSAPRSDGRGEYVKELAPSVFLETIPWPLPNVILMTTAENQPCADERMPHMMALAGMGWKTGVSVEPMLGPVKLNRIHESGTSEHGMHWESWESCLTGKRFDIFSDQETGGHPRLSWVIVGGESGPDARPMHPDWVHSLRDQCAAAGVPFFFKQWGEWTPTDAHGHVNDDCDIPAGFRADRQDWPDGSRSYLVGKHAAGRLLDGRTHDAFPEVGE